MTFSHIIWMSLKGNWLFKQSIVRFRFKIHDKNSPDARRGGIEGCYCKIHILLITWFNITWRQIVVSVNVHTLNPKGNHIPSLIIWPTVPLFDMPRCDTDGCLKRREYLFDAWQVEENDLWLRCYKMEKHIKSKRCWLKSHNLSFKL